jgi:hypothetical protein
MLVELFRCLEFAPVIALDGLSGLAPHGDLQRRRHEGRGWAAYLNVPWRFGVSPIVESIQEVAVLLLQGNRRPFPWTAGGFSIS